MKKSYLQYHAPYQVSHWRACVIMFCLLQSLVYVLIHAESVAYATMQTSLLYTNKHFTSLSGASQRASIHNTSKG